MVACHAMKVLFLVFLLCGACQSDATMNGDGGVCGSDSDCGEERFCVRANDGNRRAGTCVSSRCSNDSDCTNDRYCVKKSCVVRRIGDCDRDRMCPVGMACGGDSHQCARP